MAAPPESREVSEPPRPKAAAVAPPDSEDLRLLQTIAEATSRSAGEAFFESLSRSLAEATQVAYAFVAEFSGAPGRARTLGFWGGDRFLDDVEYDLAGTPCEDVVRGDLCHHPCRVQEHFPDDHALKDLGIESYLGVPLLSPEGITLGHLAICDTKPMPEEPNRLSVFRVFAQLAAAELARLDAQRQFEASEKRYRDLFEEAPIPYVYEDTDTTFVSANRAFMKLLGLTSGDIPGTKGLSLVAPSQETQTLVHDSLAAEQVGQERGPIEIELRRKDNGEPVFVQRWSKPEPDGKHTRTMIIDITARVLAEREKARLQQQNLYLREELQSIHNFEEIIGQSDGLRAVLRSVTQVAPADATVLILGESGTGKELIARAIHDMSSRRTGPLIKVNCASLPAGLVESELFGHEKGAFTGATTKRIGRFALADHGTIFLDEIGDMPPETQAKLLRVLQEHEFEPVGSARTHGVDVRVIAATNRDLPELVREGQFRLDLFYRLNVCPITVPPLRERREDIPLLAHYFAGHAARRLGKTIELIDAASLDRLVAARWPGNIRELENVIERAVIYADSPVLTIPTEMISASAEMHDVITLGADEADAGRPTVPPLRDAEREHIIRALEACNWRVEGSDGAARVLEVNPSTLRSRMKRLAIARGGREM